MIMVVRMGSWLIAIPCILFWSMGEVKAQERVGGPPLVGRLAASQAETKIEISFADGTLTVDLRNAEISDVLTSIGHAVKAQVEIRDGIAGKVTTSFQNRSLEDGLAALITGAGRGIVVGYDMNGTVKFIKLSKMASAWPEKVVAVKKVRDFFSQEDMASSLSLAEVKVLVADLQDQEKKQKWGKLAKKIIKIRIREAKPYLKELMDHKERYVRWEALDAFCRLVDIEDADYVLEMAVDKDWNRRSVSTCTAMPLINDPRQLQILIALLSDSNGAVVEGAMRALASKKSSGAIPALEGLLQTAGGHTRAQAAETLYSITGTKREWMTPEERRDLVFDLLVGEKVSIERISMTSEGRREAEERLQRHKKERIERLNLTPEETRDFEIRLAEGERKAIERIKE